MTDLRPISFTSVTLDDLPAAEGHVAVCVTPDGKLSPGARRINRLTKGALDRAVQGATWEKLGEGDGLSIGWPTGMAAEAVQVVKLSRRPAVEEARKAGAMLARRAARRRRALALRSAPLC